MPSFYAVSAECTGLAVVSRFSEQEELSDTSGAGLAFLVAAIGSINTAACLAARWWADKK
jgi:hypothetical protein